MVIFLSISRCINIKRVCDTKRHFLKLPCNQIYSAKNPKSQFFNYPSQFAGKPSPNSSTNTTTKKGDNVFHKRSILKSKRSSATTLHQARKHQERVSNTPRHKTLPEPQLTSDLNLTDNQGETIKPKWTKQTPATVALTAFLTTGDDRHSLTTGDKRHYHYCHLRFLHQY